MTFVQLIAGVQRWVEVASSAGNRSLIEDPVLMADRVAVVLKLVGCMDLLLALAPAEPAAILASDAVAQERTNALAHVKPLFGHFLLALLFQ